MYSSNCQDSFFVTGFKGLLQRYSVLMKNVIHSREWGNHSRDSSNDKEEITDLDHSTSLLHL